MPVKKKTATKKLVASKKKATPKSSKDMCFTIMPFGSWFDDYYDTVYCPAIEVAGLEPKRVDDLYRPSTIVNDIWSFTKAAKIILADLTDKNPNVFYELGLAHALAKPAILITESMDDVPFDLRSLRVLEYDKNRPNWGKILQSKITKSIKEVLKSPLEAVLPTFLDVKLTSKPKAVSEHAKELLEIKQELDILKREIRRSRHVEANVMEGPDEAERYLKRYLMMGMSKNLIFRRLSRRGVPEEWIKDKLVELEGPLFKNDK